MRPFRYERAPTLEAALAAAAAGDAEFLAGGTTLVDLMKLDVTRPARLIDIDRLAAGPAPELGRVATDPGGTLRLGALARMADAADHAEVRAAFPAVAQALVQAASPQLRNRASLGGCLLQRTRCPYFRDVSSACNKREPGSGCDALDGFNRIHAVLGVSEACIATYPGDLGVALVALDAEVEAASPRGTRRLRVQDLHREPGDTPAIETVLEGDELLTAIIVPATPFARSSTYYKVRDRESYAFAAASAAAAVALAGDGTVREARLALGGVATVPWRAEAAERHLVGKRLDAAVAREAGEIAMAGARTREHNAYKVPLGIETVTEALLSAGARAQA